MIRTQISLTEQQAESLRRLAAVRARSQAALIREALDDLTAAEARASRVERARTTIGAYASGTATTSEDHDVVLEDAYAE